MDVYHPPKTKNVSMNTLFDDHYSYNFESKGYLLVFEDYLTLNLIARKMKIINKFLIQALHSIIANNWHLE